MRSRRSCRWWRWASGSSLPAAVLAVALLAGAAVPARAGVPDWLKAAARQPVPAYADDVDMVILLDEQVTTIKDSGEIKTRYRRAFKILRPEGREHGTVSVYFDSETRLTYLKGWCLPAAGQEYEVKEKDAVETSPFASELYTDLRLKVLTIPAAEPGNVIGYEYEQKRRPFVLQDRWFFQDTHPVQWARFVLELPEGWEYDAIWMNHPPLQPSGRGERQWVWELRDIPEVDREPAMPPWRAVAGWLAVNYYPRKEELGPKTHASWRDVARWYANLKADRRQPTSEMQQKVAELTAVAASPLEKIRALAHFVQRDIRYVAIEIGIGGYQPHHAREVFVNRYGDCKDKVTLLDTMLRQAGIDSYHVIVHTTRGAVARDFPSMTNFNHVILALRLPAEVESTRLYAAVNHEKLGRLLFFDPTDSITPLGYLPPSLQENFGLLVTEDGGELVPLPLLPPPTNRLLRVAKLTLSPSGMLSGEVQEIRWGDLAVERRAELLNEPEAERRKVLERFLGRFLGAGFTLQSAEVENLDKFDDNLVVRYRFSAQNYAKTAGNLLLVRPRVLGQKGSSLMEWKEKKDKPRQYPVEFDSTSVQSDIFEIALPGGYQVDELSPPVEVDYGFAAYKSKVEVAGTVLRYQRDFTVKEVRVPTERLEELKKFYRQVAADERASVVLKRATP